MFVHVFAFYVGGGGHQRISEVRRDSHTWWEVTPSNSISAQSVGAFIGAPPRAKQNESRYSLNLPVAAIEPAEEQPDFSFYALRK